jgi:hypothetical protein
MEENQQAPTEISSVDSGCAAPDQNQATSGPASRADYEKAYMRAGAILQQMGSHATRWRTWSALKAAKKKGNLSSHPDKGGTSSAV